jgi:hypothetical protein
MSDEQPAVEVPDPKDFEWTNEQYAAFLMAQDFLRMMIDKLGLQMGMSAVMSGITREMRRHASIEEIQAMLRGLADTLPEVAKYDVHKGH